MGKYELAFKNSVAKDLRAIPSSDVRRIMTRIESLRDDPRPQGCEKLADLGRYRIRQGDYRIIYEISDNTLTVLVVKVGHRRDVYRN